MLGVFRPGRRWVHTPSLNLTGISLPLTQASVTILLIVPSRIRPLSLGHSRVIAVVALLLLPGA